MRIFINYKQKVEPDHSLAKSIEDGLKTLGHRVFRDESGLQAGEEFGSRIQAEIEKAHAMVSVVSNASMRSRWVKAEIEYASELKRKIIPVLVDDPKGEGRLAYLALLGYKQGICYRGNAEDVVKEICEALETGPSYLYQSLVEKEMSASHIGNAEELVCALLWLLREDHVRSLAFEVYGGYNDKLQRLTGRENRTLAESIGNYARVVGAAHKDNAGVYGKAGRHTEAEGMAVAGERIDCLSRILLGALSQWEPEIADTKRAIEETRRRSRAEGKEPGFLFGSTHEGTPFEKKDEDG